MFYNTTVKQTRGFGHRKAQTRCKIQCFYTLRDQETKRTKRVTLRVFAMLSASQTKTQNRQTCFLTENTVQGSVFTPSDTTKTANQLAPVDLKGGPPRPQADKPAEFVETIVKDILLVKE